jgi:hypothetical protein
VAPPSGSSRGGQARAWSPLRQPVYRALWLAALVSNLGTLQAIVRSFHVGAEPPLVTHLIATQPSDDD